MICSTPIPLRIWVKTKGPSPRIFRASRSITPEICPHCLRQIGLVYHQQVRLRNARSTFPGDFVATGDVDHVDGEVCQFPTEMSRQVISAGLN